MPWVPAVPTGSPVLGWIKPIIAALCLPASCPPLTSQVFLFTHGFIWMLQSFVVSVEGCSLGLSALHMLLVLCRLTSQRFWCTARCPVCGFLLPFLFKNLMLGCFSGSEGWTTQWLSSFGFFCLFVCSQNHVHGGAPEWVFGGIKKVDFWEGFRSSFPLWCRKRGVS